MSFHVHVPSQSGKIGKCGLDQIMINWQEVGGFSSWTQGMGISRYPIWERQGHTASVHQWEIPQTIPSSPYVIYFGHFVLLVTCLSF